MPLKKSFNDNSATVLKHICHSISVISITCQIVI